MLCFAPAKSAMTHLYNPQLQGRLTKAVLKKACQSRALIWQAVVFVELFGVSLVELTFFHEALWPAV